MMLLMGIIYPRKGFLFDFDWAIILESWKLQFVRATGKENNPPSRETRRSKAMRIAKEVQEDAASTDIRSHRTVGSLTRMWKIMLILFSVEVVVYFSYICCT